MSRQPTIHVALPTRSRSTAGVLRGEDGRGLDDVGFAAVGELVLTGVYEIIGPGHHFVMWAYHSECVRVVPDRFAGHHVSGVRQERWHRLEPHPTDMPILNDAGAATYPRGLMADRLAREQIAMSSLLTGEAFGPLSSGVAARR